MAREHLLNKQHIKCQCGKQQGCLMHATNNSHTRLCPTMREAKVKQLNANLLVDNKTTARVQRTCKIGILLGCVQLRGRLSERSMQAEKRARVQAGDGPKKANFL